jgi:hypothetical protein
MPRIPRPPPPQLDTVTLASVEQVLTERLKAVEIYGAPGGCPTCHDGELRGAILTVREMRERAAKPAQQA